MNRSLPTAAAILIAAACLSPVPAGARTGIGPAHGFAPGQLLVKFSGTRTARTIALPVGIGVREAVAAMRDNPRVEYAAPNYIATASESAEEPVATIPNDPGPISG